ncbi:hypothetical protein COO60DRAFT_273200 [Scenedesmus sp. NREL 46B-D3]|nr:hypothetical protein COO60DRAFT_273200 [Scenedesmus sp. NREL 46B-D3]
MAAPAVDNSDIFESDQFSDVIIALEEEVAGKPARAPAAGCDDDRAADGPKYKRPRVDMEKPYVSRTEDGGSSSGIKVLLPGHAAVLRIRSGFCRTQIMSWKRCCSSSKGKLKICIKVPPGQLAVGKLLVRCMYASQPDVSACSQEQLLQLLRLADCYDVPKVLAAVALAVAGIAPTSLEWPTVLEVFSLPPGCADTNACKVMLPAAGEKLQQELGDLELAWADAEKQQLLLSLPYGALWLLLQHPSTCVASENTVISTIIRWARAQLLQQPKGVGTVLTALEQLLQLVRMKHCTPMFLATVLPRTVFGRLLAPPMLAEAAALATAEHSGQQLLLASLVEGSLVLARWPLWAAAKRPASALQQLHMAWRLPMQQLRDAVQQHSNSAAASPAAIQGQFKCWQGHVFQPVLNVFNSSSSSSSSAEQRTVSLGLALGVQLLPGAACAATFSSSFIPAPSSRLLEGDQQQPQEQQQQQQVARLAAGPNTEVFRQDSPQEGCMMSTHRAVVHLGQLTGWSAAEAELQELGLVHSDGCLHLAVQVLSVL